jgi:SprB-like repeat protein/type IX secretion system substrate protein
MTVILRTQLRSFIFTFLLFCMITPSFAQDCTEILSVRPVENTFDNCGSWCNSAYVFTLGSGNCYTAGNDLTFTEYTDGTALLLGSVLQNGNVGQLNVTFTGRTNETPTNSPKYGLCINSGGEYWYYYTQFTGVFTFPNGSTINFVRSGPAFQVGYGGNLQDNEYGAAGWFFYSIGPNAYSGDLNFQLGSPEECIEEGIYLESECATVGSLFESFSDSEASNGDYLTVIAGNNSLNNAPNNVADRISFTVNISKSGAYNIFARVKAPSGNDDSFWVRVNDGNWIKWNNIESSSSFVWDQVHDSNNGNIPVAFYLEAGSNTIDFAYREDGTMLDKVYIAQDGIAPVGVGQDAQNCECQDQININCVAFNSVCSENEGIGINLEISGSSQNYNILWSNGATTQNISNVEPGTYSVTVTGDEGCTATCETTLIDYLPFSIVCESTNAGCGSENGGTGTVTVTGGNAPYTYHWSNDACTSYVEGLEAGIYSITVTDNNGCEEICSFEILNNEPTISVIGNASDNTVCGVDYCSLYCFESSTGNDDVSAQMSISYNEAGDQITIRTVYAKTFCDNTYGQNVIGWPGNNHKFDHLRGSDRLELVLFNGAGDESLGFQMDYLHNYNGLYKTGGINDGDGEMLNGDPAYILDVKTSISENFNTYGYVLTTDSPETDANYSPNPNYPNWIYEMWYEVTVDANAFGPSGFGYPEIANFHCSPSKTGISAEPLTLIGCCGSNCNGSIDITVTEGDAPFTYLWSNGETSEDLTDLCDGTYSVTVQDVNGCSITYDYEVGQSSSIELSCVVIEPTCDQSVGGSISATAAGDTENYTYLWSNGATTQNIDNLSAGTYSLTVTDSNGCSATCESTINQFDSFTVSCEATNTSCGNSTDGTVTVAVNGGVAPFSYLWNNGNTNSSQSNLTAGTYTVVVTDVNGCEATCSVEVISEESLIITCSSQNNTCEGSDFSTITTQVIGGSGVYTYSWSNGSTSSNLENVSAGNYSVTVADQNGCEVVCETQIDQVSPFTIACESTNTSCENTNDGTVSVTVNGGVAPFSYDWNNGNTNSSQSNLIAGTYTVVVTDANGCEATCSTQINETSSIILSCIGTEASCDQNANNAITVSVEGGTGNYTFLWNNGATTQNLDNIIAGTYSLTVTDENGCPATCETTIISNDPLYITCSLQDFICGSPNLGNITTTVTGGNGNFNYLWNDGSITSNLSQASAGIHSVTVSDGLGCSATCSVEIPDTEPIQLSCTAQSGDCNQPDSGSISTTVSGGSGTYSFLWSNGATTENLDNVATGSYSLTVTDENGCEAICETTLIGNDVINATCEGSNLICGDANSGSVILFVSGGVAPYSFLWSNGETSQNLNNLNDGVYQVSVTDANGCLATCEANVSTPAPIIVISSATTLACFGDNTATASFTVEGGTPPYTYIWDNGSTEPVIENLGAGFYGITVTDANGCTGVCGPWIESPEPINALFENTIVSCFTGNDGTINTIISGGTAPYTFLWSTGATTSNLINLVPGDYTLTVSDNNGCTNIFTTTIESNTVINSNCTSTPLSCHQDNSGSIQLNVTGGAGNYTFEWNTGATTQNLEDLNSGTYSVIITDQNGCTSTCSTTIEAPTLLTINCNPTDIICGASATGAIDIIVEGGTAPYTYQWSNGATTQNLTDLEAGIYNVIVTDANGCFTGCETTISSTVALSSTCITQDLYCGETNTGMITANIEGGTAPFSFEWSNGETTPEVSNLTEGTYEVTITDANGCNTICSSTIISIAPLSVNCQGQDLLCGEANSGNIEVSLSGGTAPFSFEWSNGAISQNLNDIPAGSYSITVTDINGCIATCEAAISYVAPLDVTCNVQNLECAVAQTGSINLNISGGTLPYSFLWNNGATSENLNNLDAGDYIVTITDANGCTTSCSSTVTSTLPLEVTCMADGVTCGVSNSGNINIDITGGEAPYSFLWNNGATTEDLLDIPSGDYEVIVTDANGCIVSCATTVEVSLGLNLSCVPVGTECGEENTGSIDLTVQGGTGNYTFEWSNDETTEDLSLLSPGSYTVTVTDSNGCTGVCSSVVEESIQLEATCVSEEIPCGGQPDGSVDVTITGGSGDYTYEWSNGETSEDITDISAGTYTVTVTDANGCTTTCSNTVTEAPGLQVSCVKTNISCKNANDGSIDVTISGGVEPLVFEWSNGANSEDLSNLSKGTYTITVTDANGCSNTCISTITEPATLLVIASGNNISCNGETDGTAFATVIGGTVPYNYEWSNGEISPFINALIVGTYTLTVTDANGCQNFGEVIITEPEILIASCFAVNETCQPASGAIDLSITGGTAPFTFDWSNGATSEDLLNIAAGDYSVIITDAKGCTAVCSSTIESGNPILISSIATNASCGTPSLGSIDLTVTGGSGSYFYQWSNGVSTEDNFNIPAGTYTVTVTDAFGCSSTNTSIVEDAPSLSIQLTTVNPECNGSANGSINLVVEQGFPPFTYQWSNGATTDNIENLSAGNYAVTVTDANGCQGLANAAISQPSKLLVICSSTPINCSGDTNGTAFVTAIGGVSPYQYTWSNDMTFPFINSLSAGTYTVTVTDANGCTSENFTTIVAPTPIEVSFTNTQLVCQGDNNGSIETTVTGGQAPYSYQWSNAESSAMIDGLSAGIYSVIITDSNGCSTAGSTTIEATNPLTVSCLAQGILCAGESNGQVDLEINGGTQPYIIEWNTGATSMSIQDLTAGEYAVTVTDANGCVAICSSVVSQPEHLNAIYGSVDISCYGELDGILDAVGQGGAAPYTYEWSTGDNTETVEGLPAGAYGLTLTDANGCIFICGLIINEPDPIICSSEVIPAGSGNLNLYDLIIDANGGTGSYQYSIDNGDTYQNSEIFSNLQVGTYTVLISDENGCTGECGTIEVGSLDLGSEDNTRTALSPNPAQDELKVAYETPAEAYTIFEVKNMDGKVIYKKEMVTQAGENTFSVNTSNYAGGTYILVIYTDKDVQSKQFTVLKSIR